MLRAQGGAGAASYCIAVGPQAGSKVFTLQTLPASEEPFADPVGQVAGLSFGTSLYLTPTRQPAAVQIGRPADAHGAAAPARVTFGPMLTAQASSLDLLTRTPDPKPSGARVGNIPLAPSTEW